MNDLYKMSSFYMYSLESFLDVIIRAIKVVAMEYEKLEQQQKEEEKGEEENADENNEEKKE